MIEFDLIKCYLSSIDKRSSYNVHWKEDVCSALRVVHTHCMMIQFVSYKFVYLIRVYGLDPCSNELLNSLDAQCALHTY